MNLSHDLIEYIYHFLDPNPCRSKYILLDKEMYHRYNQRTHGCKIVYFYGLVWCETHRFVRPTRHDPGCITS